MKKLLAIFLALVTILSITLVACNSKPATTQGNNSNENEEEVEFVNNKNQSNSSDTTDASTNKATEGGWEAAAYTIYCMADGVNVRNADSKSSEKLGSLKLGDSVTAVERNDKWYKITFDGKTAYVSRDYMTAVKDEATFTRLETPEKLTVAEAYKDSQIALRKDPVIMEDTLAAYFKGTDAGVISKVGANADGSWYIISYDADGEGEKLAVEYYVSMGSAARNLFGIAGGSAGGYS